MKPFIAFLFLSTALLSAGEPAISWTLDFGQPVNGARPIWNAGAAEGVAVTLASGEIVILDAKGKRLSSAKLDAHASVPAIAGDLWGKNKPGLVAVDEWGSVYAFNLKGERVWKYTRTTKTGDFRMSSIAEFDHEGRGTFLMEDWLGGAYAVDSNGKLRLDVSSARSSPPAVADVNGDGKSEIIIGTEDGTILCLTRDGEVVWTRNYPGKFGRSIPVVADTDRDGRYEVYLSTPAAPTGLYALDAATGEKLWFAPSSMQSYQAIAIADLDGDGKDEILYADKNTRLYCVDSKGHALWDTQVGGRGIFFSPVILDTSAGKRIFQVARATGVNGKTLYEIDARGHLLGEYAVPGGGAGSPVLFHFQGDAEPSMLVVPIGNQVICYKFTPSDHIVWPGPRNDLQNSGFMPNPKAIARKPVPAPALKPAVVRAALMGENTVTIPAPSQETGFLRVKQPDGTVKVTTLAAGTAQTTFEAMAPGAYDVSLRFPNAPAAPSQHYTYTLDREMKADRELLSACQQKLRQFQARLKDRRNLLDYLDITAHSLFEQAVRSGSATRFTEARAYYDYAIAFAAAIDRSHPAGDLLVQPIANPWVTFDAVQHLRQATAGVDSLALTMLGNEYESKAVAVSNLQDHAVTVRVTAAPFDGPAKTRIDAALVIEIREAPLVLTEAGVITEDVLPLLGEGQTIRLGPGETRKLWLVIHSRALPFGAFDSKLIAADLLSPGAPTELPVKVNVRALRLPEGFTYRHCSWFYAAGVADPALRQITIDNVVSHGMNVFMLPAPNITVDNQGNVTSTDNKQADELIGIFRGKSPKGRATFLVNGYVNLAWPQGFKPTPEIADRGLGNALHWYTAHMKSVGLDASDYALYTQDEPGLMGKDAAFDQWVVLVKQIKRLEPGIWMYADPAGGADAEMLAPVADLIEIWQPDLGLLRDPKRGPALDRLFRRAKLYWHYEAPGDSRTLDSQGYYRAKAWFAFQAGITGGGFWVYSDSPFWGRYQRSSEYGTVYPTEKGPVTTRRWEGSRDGSEDFELLTIVKERAAKRPNSPDAAAALALLDEAVRFVNSGPAFGHENKRLGMPVADYAKWQDYKDRLAAAAEKLVQ